ncbi:HNH endonuclease [Glaciihabitans arcticus]|uniref:HNH endonuclease n=1 Tax=Glaciihabitans arcticus TaxID=2668039 RepID=A0A4V2JEP6_9MICO|nr:HNH endonuclease signature motif containing protein [Glaciihabitans arcticus]TBN56419.1 HNH endonuclease [Glaciihabitans arcticus]
MNRSAPLLAQAISLLAEVSSAPITGLADDELCSLAGAVEHAGRLVDALRATSAAEIDDRSRYELGRDGLAQRHGLSRGAHLVENITRVSPAEAARRTRLGIAIRPRAGLTGEQLPPAFPEVARAMLGGDLGVDAASTIVRILAQADRPRTDGTRPEPELVTAAEIALVETATHEPSEIVAVQARVWREALDPDGARPRDEALREARAFRVGREVDGMTPFSGVADPVNAALLRAALSERHRTPKLQFFAEGDCDETDGEPAFDDPRSREQRHFDIIMGLVTAGVRTATETDIGYRPTASVMAVVSASDLEKGTGVGWLDDVGEPVSLDGIQELICEGGLQQVVLGEHGEVLLLGELRRLFTKAQRRALAVRDGGCVWPSCTAPPGWCHAHHVVEWSNGGPTDIDNGVLLCPAHHHGLHSSRFRMEMRDGRPWLLAPPWLDPSQTWRLLGKQRATMVAA